MQRPGGAVAASRDADSASLDPVAFVFLKIAVESVSWIPASAQIRAGGSVHRRPQEIPVTVLGHPARTGEVAVVHATGAFSVLLRIEPE
jgi:hypothetical protein